MRGYTFTGIIFTIIGIVTLAYQGATYTTRENVDDNGPVRMSAGNTNTFPLPLLGGAAALQGGILLLIAGGKIIDRRQKVIIKGGRYAG
ncbi:MAG: hypothetical protein A2511_01560 [Deltaproteobacteria bacterium RIFOXYD12_FULL_50_9]|nr:MAG: hypothetical protein A2511_01560 [Deltaproteobacteria bacterium RIFOXYD12_FULL_50_9]